MDAQQKQRLKTKDSEQGSVVDYKSLEHGSDLEKGSTATPFSRLTWALLADDYGAVAAQLADEWVMMPNLQKFSGKDDVIKFMKAGKEASTKEPVPLVNVANNEWGVWEYINVGTVTKNMRILAATDADFQLGAKDTSAFEGRRYFVAICFVYHINAEGKIFLVHEYLDLENLKKQFK
jgi:limonene-1,2-epoxide hydrolase